MLFQVYPALIPAKSRRRYEPKIFGFKVHAAAALARWQDEYRRKQRLDLTEAGIGMVDVPATAAANDGTAAAGGEGTTTQKVQKLFVEDEESDDGMAEVEEETRVRRLEDERGANAAKPSV